MFKLPDYVIKVLNTFKQHGYEAYVVGGCVRNMLLNIPPHDYDITTNCFPEDMVKLFDKTVETGVKYGTVTIIEDGIPIEVTTYRTDVCYTDHRKPDCVNFTRNLYDDLARRDFTVNAMAYNQDRGLIDIFNGAESLKKNELRAVGDPEKRFSEDALRILRCVRFASEYGFDIERQTLIGIEKTAHLLKFVSMERVFSELIKTLMGKYPQKIEILIQSGALSFLGIEKINSPINLSNLSLNRELRFYMFCKLCGVDAQNLCILLKGDNKLKKYCEELNSIEKDNLTFDKSDIKKMLSVYSPECVCGYAEIRDKADICNKTVQQIKDNGEPYKIAHLNINGTDLLNLGFKNSEIGTVLNRLLDAVIEKPQKNNKKTLINLAKQIH